MEQLIGKRLVREGILTEEQIEEALSRQKLHGGRLGDNLVALGYLTKEQLEAFFRKSPPIPKNIHELGIPASFIADLVLKITLGMGDFTIADVASKIKLPISIVDNILQILRRDRFVEVRGGSDYRRTSYQYTLTGAGRSRAIELLEICQYTGPAPVTYESYKEFVINQTIKNVRISEEAIKNALSDLTISDDLLKRIGLAVSSGRSIFLYGPPGNGKTEIALRISSVFNDNIYIPYAIYVSSYIIRIFSPANHQAVNENETNAHDPRWILIKRPVIRVGGELTLKMLELNFDPVSKFYEAPLQLKANNGIFIIDDFGRQLIKPGDLLNRWIVPLDRRIDYLSLHTGMCFEVPFDQLVVFATNIEPKELVDEAFLRRIRYKIKIDYPTKEEFREIFIRVCEKNNIDFKEEVFEYLIRNYYEASGIKLCACHPVDLIDQIIDMSRYHNTPPILSRDTIDAAWKNYFVRL